ncbi:UNVERIFIED_CONTAM: hypothetical protein K2H54_054824 [Gekko kuhli]
MAPAELESVTPIEDLSAARDETPTPETSAPDETEASEAAPATAETEACPLPDLGSDDYAFGLYLDSWTLWLVSSLGLYLLTTLTVDDSDLVAPLVCLPGSWTPDCPRLLCSHQTQHPNP